MTDELTRLKRLSQFKLSIIRLDNYQAFALPDKTRSQTSKTDRSHRLLVGVLDRVQCEVLIDFQAFLALMARDELDLRIRQTVRGQPGDHLMAEEMRVHRLGNAGAGGSPARAAGCGAL